MMAILMSYLSMMTIFLKHPLSLGIALIVQASLSSLYSGLIYKNFWFSYILFLVMIGGIMIMFIYMTSIASNEKFSLPKISIKLIPIGLALIIAPLMFYSPIMNSQENSMEMTLSKFLSYPKIQMVVFLMIYLFITLIAVVKISSKSMGPLRQK